MIFLLLVLLSNDEEIMIKIKMIKIWWKTSPKKSPLACNEKNFKHII